MAPKKTTKEVAKSIHDRLNEFLETNTSIKDVTGDCPELIRTGITNLDATLGGGIILGGLIQLVGRAGCGKSSMAAKIISSFQKETNGKALCIYLDTETTMTKHRLSQLGVNNPQIKPKSDITLEDIFKIIQTVIDFKKENKDARDIPTIIVWDSIASTLTQKEFTAEDPKEVIGYKARLLSLYLPKIASSIQEYKISVIAINQMRDAVGIGMMPTPVAIKGMKQSDTIPGGRALQFATSQLIYMNDVGNLEERIYGFDGKEVDIQCIKNKAFPPLIKTKTCFSYMGGYSNFWSAFAVLKAEKRIIISGAWYSMPGYEKKFQASKVSDLYVNDENFRNVFDNLIKEYAESIAHKYLNQLESCNIDDIISNQLKSPVSGTILDTEEIKETLTKANKKAKEQSDVIAEAEIKKMEDSKAKQEYVLNNKKLGKSDVKKEVPKKSSSEPTLDNLVI